MMVQNWNNRSCMQCGVQVIDVRDVYTGGTYPVEAVGITGLTLEAADDARRNPVAIQSTVFLPHLPRCGLPQGPYIPVGMGDAPDPGTGFIPEGDDQEELEEESPGP